MKNLRKAFLQVFPYTFGMCVIYTSEHWFKSNFKLWPDAGAILFAIVVGSLGFAIVLTPIAYLMLRWQKKL